MYEHFLGEYDHRAPQCERAPTTRPNDVVGFMVRFVEEILRVKMGKSWGLASDDVGITDPSMGTGTFLLNIIDSVAATITAEKGPAAVAPQLRALLGRLIGFEKQTGLYAIAELRIHQALRAKYGIEIPERKMPSSTSPTPSTILTPNRCTSPIASTSIAHSHREANKISRDQPVSRRHGQPSIQRPGEGHGWVDRARRQHTPAWTLPCTSSVLRAMAG